MSMKQNDPSGLSFETLGLHPKLLAALRHLKFTTPTPVQHRSIPFILTGKDLLAIAQTGTGKTLAFGLPMVQRLGQTKGQGLVLVPTRELALQVEENLLKVAGPSGLRTALLMGGAPIYQQKRQLSRNPHVLIATPGRMIDFLRQKALSLARVHILVLDEADRMLDMGFAPQIRQIIQQVPAERQTLLFSATMPKELVNLAHSIMRTPYQIEVSPSGTTVESVEQIFLVLPKTDKLDALTELLRKAQTTVLIFTRTKHGATKLTRSLKTQNFTAAEIHSNRSLGQRRAALEGFKRGTYRILVATDIAARGIDVKDIGMVVNFDLPDNPEDYVHRIGRTARAGKEGVAISFATPDQRKDLQTIERLIRKPIKVHHRVPFDSSASSSGGAHRGGRRSGPRRRHPGGYRSSRPRR